MEHFNTIEQKLQQFSRKYYINELIKGSILFIALGLCYFLGTLFIEYFLWLEPTARTILFWLFVLVELFLLIRFIGFPIFKILGLQKGISLEEASKIIGNHFPEVKDKLLNVLQLKNSTLQSDLLSASIDQKANELQPIPFTKAINFKTNTTYIKYACIPVLIWLLTLFSGAYKGLHKSLQRVVNHSIAYVPPAPFSLSLTTDNLQVIQGKPITVYIEAKGEVLPEEAKIVYDKQQYFLQNNGAGLFSYTFPEVNNSITFYAEANGIQSPNYQIEIVKTPTIQNVSMRLLYPKYLGKTNETISNTGNITVPQGTRIQWNVQTHQADSVVFINQETRAYFVENQKDNFVFSKRILQNTNYEIATSNQQLKEYEKLQFSVGIIKDEYPTITVQSNIDSVSRGPAQFAGHLSDDYGIRKLELVYYDVQNPQKKEIHPIQIGKETIQTFFYQFPDGVNLTKGVDYELFFQVFDNDAIQGNKKAMSQKFSYRQKTEQEVEDELLQEQRNYIKNLENSLEKQQKSKKDLEKIQFDLQNKKNINWNDQKKIEKLVKRQQQYKQMMQRQTEKLEENFTEKKEETEKLQDKKEELKKRIDELKKLDKQQKLLDELMKMAEKLNKDDLIKKTKELAQQNKQKERSLERVLELTKRFYVEQKTTQLVNKLQELAKKQEELANKNASKKEQEAIKKEFEKIQEEMKALQKDNKKLKEPMEIPEMQQEQKETKKALAKSEENLNKQQQSEAKKNQKKAAQKMKQMSNQMQKSMEAMSSEMEQENEEDLRKVVENLLTFSFQQEDLMEELAGSSSSHPNFGKNLKKQYQLKEYFEHIDDSLFVLSMRVPKISAKVQDELATAHYNLDQALENFAENYFRKGTSNQRYVMTAANTLADMLSNVLNAMKNPQQGSGKGKGKGESFSLPDIIQKQQQLMQQMKKGMQQQQQGKSGKQQNGEQQQGKGSKPKGGKNGQQGKNGESEQMNGELYQIYKEQAQLRQQLEDALKNGKGGNGKAKQALKKMEQLENEILEKGFNQNTLQRMQQLNYELLKLDKATFEQGRDKQRKANTNQQEYQNKNNKQLQFKKLFYNQTEILNRQSLPLRQTYKKKVQEYFSVPNNSKK